MKVILLYPDIRKNVGLGHFYRCLSVAEYFEGNNCKIIFVVEEQNDSVIKKISDSNFETIRIDEVLSFDFSTILFIDHYHPNLTVLSPHYTTVNINDIPSESLETDYVINHCGGFSLSQFNLTKAYQLVFSGLEYAFLRKEYLLLEKKKQVQSNLIVICLGGSDPLNISQEIYCYIKEELKDSIVKIITSRNNKNELNLIKTDEVLYDIDVDQMKYYMRVSQLFICSSSTVSYEALSQNANVLLIKYVENQRFIFNYLTKQFNVGGLDYQELSFKKNFNALVLKAFIDCKQVKFDIGKKLNNTLSKIFIDSCLLIRKADVNDSIFLLDLANEDEVRKVSLNKQKITIEEHRNWLAKSLVNKNRCLYVAEVDNKPFGQIRFDVDHKEITVSISIIDSFRGKGYGLPLLRKGVKQFLEARGEEYLRCQFIAIINPKNTPSITTFKQFGFVHDSMLEVNKKEIYCKLAKQIF